MFAGPLETAAAAALADAFKAIADPARVRLLNLIAAQPGGEACVCHLTARLGLSQPTVSHHLKRLSDAGLIAGERRGTWVHYRVVPERLAALYAALAPPEARQPRRRRSGPRGAARGGR